MSSGHDCSLVSRVRRGELNFERLVELLSTRGYVTDSEDEPGLSFNRPSMNQARSADFNALFKALMPGRINDIEIMAIGTPWDDSRGSTYALFNINRIEYEEMMQTIKQINSEVVPDL